MMEKVGVCFDHGSEEVWLLYPKLKELHRYQRTQASAVHRYSGNDMIDASPLFPGLTLITADLFKLHK
ncbi:MAG TPA: hypothetical protein VHD90_17835 [Phototrophicaceae bacterium]|nr:hypothetical protein [Phototrophicaceae bacterium]